MQNEWILFGGCILAGLAFFVVLIRYKTFLYGLSALCAFAVASSGLSAFVVAMIFNIPLAWYTEYHMEVIEYTSLGLLAMAIGVFLAWRPLAAQARAIDGLKLYVPVPEHFNQDVGWLTFVFGALAELFYPLVASVPTVSTAVSALTTLDRIGLCVLLVNAIRTRAWRRFGLAFAIFWMLSLMGAVTSGFSFIRINTLLPLAMIWLVYAGWTLRNVIGLAVVIPVSIAAISAWLESRMIIRTGALEGMPMMDRVTALLGEFWDRFRLPDGEAILRTLLERVDMTDIYAAQVAYQPTIEPYAHGETFFSSLYTLIPRAIWADKPEIAGGSAFVAQYTGLFRAVDDQTSVGLPYPFELYANGGPWWVIIGLGIVAYVLARLELRMLAPQRSLGGFWAVALVAAYLSEGGQRSDVVLPALVASGLSAYALGSIVQRFILRDRATWIADGQSRLRRREAGPVGHPPPDLVRR